jgi:hypothetical protein
MPNENVGTTPSKVEKLKERMRQKQGLPPAKGTALPSSTVPTAPPPPATVKHVCGHEAPFQEIAKDKFRNERYQKELKRPCPTCREANREANEEAGRKTHEEKQAKKNLSFKQYTDPGTGVGYSFIFQHLGVAHWEWSLVKMSGSQEVGKGTSKNLRLALGAMNEILSKLEQQEATPDLGRPDGSLTET